MGDVAPVAQLAGLDDVHHNAHVPPLTWRNDRTLARFSQYVNETAVTTVGCWGGWTPLYAVRAIRPEMTGRAICTRSRLISDLVVRHTHQLSGPAESECHVRTGDAAGNPKSVKCSAPMNEVISQIRSSRTVSTSIDQLRCAPASSFQR